MKTKLKPRIIWNLSEYSGNQCKEALKNPFTNAIPYDLEEAEINSLNIFIALIADPRKNKRDEILNLIKKEFNNSLDAGLLHSTKKCYLSRIASIYRININFNIYDNWQKDKFLSSYDSEKLEDIMRYFDQGL